MLNTLETEFGKDYRDAVVQRDLAENMRIANDLIFAASLGADFMAAVQYNASLEAMISDATASIGNSTTTLNTVNREASNIIRNSTLRDSETGRFIQNPAIGTTSRYSPITTVTKDLTQETMSAKYTQEVYEQLKASAEAEDLRDAIEVLFKALNK